MKPPKYLIVKNDLLNKIENGVFKPGDKFYTEIEIEALYNISSITAIRSIRELAKDGYLERYQGRGTYVARSKRKKIVEFSDVEIFSGDEELIEVLSVDEQNESSILKKLNLTQNNSYFKISRRRIVNDYPYMIQNSYIPAKYIKQDISYGYYDSIYGRFKSDFNINMYDMHSVETNESLATIPVKIASLLKIMPESGCILQIKTTDNELDEIYEYIESYKCHPYYKIRIETVLKR